MEFDHDHYPTALRPIDCPPWGVRLMDRVVAIRSADVSADNGLLSSESTAPAGPARYAIDGEPAWRRGLILALFVAVGAVNIMDRNILSIANEAIKAELHFSDTQLGLLSGAAFAVFYAICGLPMAWVADRRERPKLIAGVMTLWSGATALCGLATTFVQLALCRVGVAVGESGATPAMYALVSDRYPPSRRGLALAIAGLGTSIGTFLALVGGGYVVQTWGWRHAFFAAAAPGVVLALIVFLVVPDPRHLISKTTEGTPSIGAQLKSLLSDPAYRWLLVGALFAAIGLYGTISWLPSFFHRLHDWKARDTGLRLGVGLGLMGIAGNLAIGAVTNWWTKRNFAAPASMSAILMTLSVPLLLVAIYAHAPWLALAVFIPSVGAMQGSSVSFHTASQNLAPAHARALVVSLALVVSNLFGMSLGAGLVGYISDANHAALGAHSLQVGLLVSPAATLLGAIAFAISARKTVNRYPAANSD